MQPEAIEDLVRRIGASSAEDAAIAGELLAALGEAARRCHSPVPFDVACLGSFERALEAVDHVLPHWRVQLDRAGGWRCALRESGTRDDDELIGVGTGPTPAFALLAAFLAVIARRARGYR